MTAANSTEPVFDWTRSSVRLSDDEHPQAHFEVPFTRTQTVRFATFVVRAVEEAVRGNALLSLTAGPTHVRFTFSSLEAMSDWNGARLRVATDDAGERARADYLLNLQRDMGRASGWLNSVIGRAPELTQIDVD